MRPTSCRISFLSWVVMVDMAELTMLVLETGGVKVMKGMGLEGPATTVVVMARVVLVVFLRGLTRCVGALVVVVMAAVVVVMAVVVVDTAGGGRCVGVQQVAHWRRMGWWLHPGFGWAGAWPRW